VAAPLLYQSPGAGLSRRRGTDFYPEGDLIWLEVDTIIRQQSLGEKSLDDFCKKFYGGEDTAPTVAPYKYEDVIHALNGVAPYGWNSFFQKRVYEINARAPLGGIENGGWHLAWTNQIPAALKLREDQRKFTDLAYSLGFSLGTDGGIGDVLHGSPADQAGMIQGMKLVAVDGRAWSVKLLRDALKTAATNDAPVSLLTVNDDYYRTFTLDYHGGEQYPILQRDSAQPDLLAEILKPLTPEPATNAPAVK